MLIRTAYILVKTDIVILHMINFLYKAINRKPIHLQLNNFFEWKTSFCADVLEHKQTLTPFVKFLGVEDMYQVQEEQVLSYLNKLRAEHGAYSTMRHMKTIKSFLNYGYRRGYRCMNPKLIRIKADGEILILKNVGENDRIVPVIMQKPLGRPANVEAIEKVKLLRDSAHLSFRQIARAMSKPSEKPVDVSQVHVWYNYPNDKLVKRKEAMMRK